jgi:hypothetical protein
VGIPPPAAAMRVAAMAATPMPKEAMRTPPTTPRSARRTRAPAREAPHGTAARAAAPRARRRAATVAARRAARDPSRRTSRR